MQQRKQSFNPIATKQATILILGSLPGDASLTKQEYYAHPQNKFWRLMAAVLQTNIPQTYNEKIALLTTHNIALWDVAATAVRKGSLDSAMQEVVPNNIDAFLQEHTTITTIAFNGLKAAALYKKHVTFVEHIRYITLPSSSPANAGKSFELLVKEWQKILS
jgi:hypoxanthine-DNA glycosylase